MHIRLAVVVVASFMGLGACTTVGESPATAPPVTAAETTTTTMQTPTTLPEATTTTTTSRLAEIQAIFQDLEVRRLQAIMDQDEEAFRSVFANDEYEERSMVLMDEIVVVDPQAVAIEVADVYFDGPGCIAIGAVVDASDAIEGGGVSVGRDRIVELDGVRWGMSWVGEGWRCDGPHPFSD